VMPAAAGITPGTWCEATFTGATSWDVWAEPAG
jgi:hypothetical protein